MSFFNKMFGSKSSKQAAPTPAEAIQKLREVEEMLLKKQDYLEKKQNEELLVIKKNGTKNKRVSLQALKRKKRIDKQLEQIDGLYCIGFKKTILLISKMLKQAHLQLLNTNEKPLKMRTLTLKFLRSWAALPRP